MLAIARDGQHVPRRRRHVAAKTKRAAQAAGACRNARGSASVATGQARKEAVIRQARTDGSATRAGGTACPRPGGRQKVKRDGRAEGGADARKHHTAAVRRACALQQMPSIPASAMRR
jgi:hypothetical protein